MASEFVTFSFSSERFKQCYKFGGRLSIPTNFGSRKWNNRFKIECSYFTFLHPIDRFERFWISKLLSDCKSSLSEVHCRQWMPTKKNRPSLPTLFYLFSLLCVAGILQDFNLRSSSLIEKHWIHSKRPVHKRFSGLNLWLTQCSYVCGYVQLCKAMCSYVTQSRVGFSWKDERVSFSSKFSDQLQSFAFKFLIETLLKL